MEKNKNRGIDRYTKAQLAECLDNLPVCTTITSKEGIFEFANKKYYDVTGISPEMVEGRYFDDLVKEGIYIKQSYSMIALEKKQTVTAVSFENPFGNHKHGFVTSVPIFDENGDVVMVLTTILDSYDLRSNYLTFAAAMKRQNQKVVDVKNSADFGTFSEHFIGNSPQMEEIRAFARKVAPTTATILITGESGSGKEALADYIYDNSSRRGKPFIKVNCAAIPENLLESELFGYEKGAFTGASNKGKKGLLEMANGGTILLDEIGDFPLFLQPKLLRVLQQGEMFRIGGNTPIKLDVRYIAATNSKLEKKIAEGKFRVDLYYRLKVIPFEVPPIREHPEDIPFLVERFVNMYNEKHNRKVFVTNDVMNIFKNYEWWGNVREMQNVIEYAIVCTDYDKPMDANMIKSLLNRPPEENPNPQINYDVVSKGKTLFEQKDAFEKSIIEQTILSTGNLREASRQLGIYISSLYRKIEKLNIDADYLLAKSKTDKR